MKKYQRRRRHKAEPAPDFGRGAFRGYVDYRYGSTRAYAPGKHPAVKAAIGAETRRMIVEHVVRGMEGWKSSPFEFEGAALAGLRSGFCLAGERWQLSDLLAADVVAEALRIMKVSRPTWEQGQPEYADVNMRCAQCKCSLRDEHLSGNRRARYCSPECAKAATVRIDMRDRPRNESFRKAAHRLVYQSQLPQRACAECSAMFRPALRLRETQRFCSVACSYPEKTRQRYLHECRCCRTPFRSAVAEADFCSQTCRTKTLMMDNGKWSPKKISPVVFDHFVSNPMERGELTPLRFDAALRPPLPRISDCLFT